MAWTYSGDPATSDRDHLRFITGDTDQNRPLWQDEEIDFLITQTTSLQEAARQLLQSKITQLALSPRVRLGRFTFDASSLLRALKENLEALGVTHGSMAPWAGGISKTQKAEQETRGDRVAPRFKRGQFDNRRAGTSQE